MYQTMHAQWQYGVRAYGAGSYWPGKFLRWALLRMLLRFFFIIAPGDPPLWELELELPGWERCGMWNVKFETPSIEYGWLWGCGWLWSLRAVG